MAESGTRLPTELIDLALSFLTPIDPIQDRDLRETLKACCLTGSVIRELARPLLFKHLVFKDPGVAYSVFERERLVSDNKGDLAEGASAVEDTVPQPTMEIQVHNNENQSAQEFGLPSLEPLAPLIIPGLAEQEEEIQLEEPLVVPLFQEVFTIPKFADLLSTTPEIGGFVRGLTIWLDPEFTYNPWMWECANVIEPIGKEITQLQSFAFVRSNPETSVSLYHIQSRTEDVLWTSLGDGFRSFIIQMATLPTLEKMDLTYGIMFPDPATFCRVFCDCSPKLKELRFSCLAFASLETMEPIVTYPADQPVPTVRPTISFIELNWIESFVQGPALVEMLFGKYSPFDISQLEGIRVNGIESGDDWIDTILSKQKDHLVHLKNAFFHEIWDHVAPDVPFRRIAQLQGLLPLKVEPTEAWTNWLKILPIQKTLLDQTEDAYRPWRPQQELLHQIFKLGPKSHDEDAADREHIIKEREEDHAMQE
ncbi:hypothetical protein DL96DRAFT_1581309 [Flagelloscypha sp. PMI_526]|nr:hypothetical protein DL96DRAFT_1581309 [Flagelloscypha sp. PMI_526]